MLRPSIIYYIVLMEQSIYKIMEQSENSEIELNYLGLTEIFFRQWYKKQFNGGKINSSVTVGVNEHSFTQKNQLLCFILYKILFEKDCALKYNKIHRKVN